jgi:hypothetical protein
MHVEEEERRLGWNQFHLGSKISNETGYRRCQYESYVELSFQKCCAMIELLHYQSGKHGFHSSRFKVRKVFFGCAWLFDWFKWPASVEWTCCGGDQPFVISTVFFFFCQKRYRTLLLVTLWQYNPKMFHAFYVRNLSDLQTKIVWLAIHFSANREPFITIFTVIV